MVGIGYPRLLGCKGPNGLSTLPYSGAQRERVCREVARDRSDTDLLTSAISGDVVAIKEIFDRVEGKPMPVITGGDEDEGPIKFTLEPGRTVGRIHFTLKDANVP
jgi:hypothetical protein